MKGFHTFSTSRLLLFLATLFASCNGIAGELFIEDSLGDASLEFASHIVHLIWDHGTDLAFAALWGCEEDNRVDSGIIPTDEVWGYIRYTYERTVGRKVRAPANLNTRSGFQVDVNITHSKKGRGVIAAQPIKAGTVVYNPYYSGEFLTAAEFRRFLQALPPYLVCDILMWTYVRLNEEEEPRICMELDSSCMLNEADEDEIVNLIPAKGMGRYSGCKLELVAKKDIAEGEELLMDYNFSEGTTGWSWMGLNNDEEVFHNDIAWYYEEVAKWHENMSDEL